MHESVAFSASGSYSHSNSRSSLADAYYKRGLLWLRNFKHDAALQDLDAAIGMWDCIDDPANLFRLRGKLYLERGDTNAATRDCNSALEIDPNDEGSHVLRALLRLLRGDVTNAIADCNTALASSPDDEYAYIIRGLARIDEQDFTGALLDANRALKLDSNGEDAYMVRGRAAVCLELYEPGIQDLTRVLRVKPSSDDYCIRAWAYLKTRAYMEAISDAKDALVLEPNSALAYKEIAMACASLGQVECATSAKRAAQKLDPTLTEFGDLGEFKFLVVPPGAEWYQLDEHP